MLHSAGWRKSKIRRRTSNTNPGSSGSPLTVSGSSSASGPTPGRYTCTCRWKGSMSQPSSAPLATYTCHLAPEGSQTVAAGAHFDHKGRAERQQPVIRRGIGRRTVGLLLRRNPGRIRSITLAVGQTHTQPGTVLPPYSLTKCSGRQRLESRLGSFRPASALPTALRRRQVPPTSSWLA